MLDTVKINHVQHISFTQSRLTDAVSVILSELLSYEHPSKAPGLLSVITGRTLTSHPPPGKCRTSDSMMPARRRSRGSGGRLPGCGILPDGGACVRLPQLRGWSW